MPGNKPDNSILMTTIALAAELPTRSVILVSKDINLRIKAAIVGAESEDYNNDKVLEDADLLYSGYLELPGDFWQTHGDAMDSWQDALGRACYRIKGPLTKQWYVNQFLYIPDDEDGGLELIVHKVDAA